MIKLFPTLAVFPLIFNSFSSQPSASRQRSTQKSNLIAANSGALKEQNLATYFCYQINLGEGNSATIEKHPEVPDSVTLRRKPKERSQENEQAYKNLEEKCTEKNGVLREEIKINY